jgi:hypothetical protein
VLLLQRKQDILLLDILHINKVLSVRDEILCIVLVAKRRE